jgi:hypothetical protein
MNIGIARAEALRKAQDHANGLFEVVEANGLIRQSRVIRGTKKSIPRACCSCYPRKGRTRPE